MYAVMMFLRIDQDQAPQAASTFSEKILPQVKAASGFVKGYWVDPLNGEGFGFMIFETENDAIAATPPAADWSAPGVTVEKINIRRVAVEA